MKVLVTGSTSVIGAAVVDRLISRGDEVTTLQRRPGRAVTAEVHGDVADPSTVDRAVEGHDAVVHLAAKVDVTGPSEDYRRTNVGGTVNVVDAARRYGVGRVVHVSSPSVAHGGDALVAADAGAADPTVTRGHYSTSKAVAEVEALARADSDLAVVAIRPHLVWGPGDTQLVGRIVERARQRRLATIGTGAALIDSTYLDNAADALVAALDRVPAISGEALVVSNGEPRPVRELIERIVTAAGLEMPGVRVPGRVAFAGGLAVEQVWSRLGRDDEPPMTSFLAEQLTTAHWFDQRRTRELLGWTPSVSLAEGFERLTDWYRSTD
ncbi:MAG: NAD-dependent epimerase/dehydratase family protein [Actinomycetota bacterium]